MSEKQNSSESAVPKRFKLSPIDTGKPFYYTPGLDKFFNTKDGVDCGEKTFAAAKSGLFFGIFTRPSTSSINKLFTIQFGFILNLFINFGNLIVTNILHLCLLFETFKYPFYHAPR